jgi:hypothetical protein
MSMGSPLLGFFEMCYIQFDEHIRSTMCTQLPYKFLLSKEINAYMFSHTENIFVYTRKNDDGFPAFGFFTKT